MKALHHLWPLACGLWPILFAAAAFVEPPADPPALERAFHHGNYKDAYDGYRRLALAAAAPPREVGDYLGRAIQCLHVLGRVDEIDDFREQAIKIHTMNWRLLRAAAESFADGDHNGFLVAGRFERGNKRGGGQAANAAARDRVRALQLMVEAMPLVEQEPDKNEMADFFFSFARMLSSRNYQEAWRLQYRSDLAQWPDYDEGWYYGSPTAGAPVGADGQPVYYSVPAGFDEAQNDGQRWRWALARVAELAPDKTGDVRWELAAFAQSQFGVQTLANYGHHFRGPWANDDRDNQSGAYALHTLGENETIARLATGIHRFVLPDEFNYVKIYQQIAADPRGGRKTDAIAALALEFENRRQYPRAAEFWRAALLADPKNKASWQVGLDAIERNWGRFEPAGTQPAGQGATVDFRFRNGQKVHFDAHKVNVERLLADVKAYLRSNPAQLDWNALNIGDIGYRLVEKNEGRYLGDRVATWDMDLEPREGHFDKRVTVTTPLTKAGAYLVTATMAEGNTSRIVLWVADTAVVKKPLGNKTLYYVADAVTGEPIERATVELFGYSQKQVDRNRMKVDTVEMNLTTDRNGQVLPEADKNHNAFNWLVTARTRSGRLAYLGFTYVWQGNVHDQQYNQTRVFTITDRPVYRPDQTVKFKFWIRQAQYDQDGSTFARQNFAVQVVNPRGEKILEQPATTDEFGGVEGEYQLPADAMLGVYQLILANQGGGSFRVEEYKKPEFEVTVDAPKKPVMLGEKIQATVSARYYFGSPVTEAKVKYKVLRTTHTDRWYPVGAWDWFYGPGYWWFAYDYDWYPRWREWSCCGRPAPWWWPRSYQPPEVVADAEVPIGPDGKVTIDIDTAIAKELHGHEDQEYSITAEVVDQSRRTIVGAGNVLVARQPFKVAAWVDRGFYRTGDTVRASFSAHTLDRQPVEGTGKLTLYKVSYDDSRKAVETPLHEWDVNTNAEGRAEQKLEASAAGQYRLAYRLTDAAGHAVEGGYLFNVRGAGFTGAGFRFNHVELVPDTREYQPGGKVRLMINTDRVDSTVLLFVRPANGVYLPPKMIRVPGKSTVEEIEVTKKDMPNFFVEAVTVADGRIYSETKEIVVPPESRVLNVAVDASATEYKPGQEAEVRFKLTDFYGKPFVGTTVLSVYDKSLEYIAGGSNVPEIKEFFWKWRRQHYPQTESSLQWFGHNVVHSGEPTMRDLGIFGSSVVDELDDKERLPTSSTSAAGMPRKAGQGRFGGGGPMLGEVARANEDYDAADRSGFMDLSVGQQNEAATGNVQPTVRTNFADTAYWAGSITTDAAGTATVRFKMPENLTTWRVKVWGLGQGTRVGQGEADVVTRKNLIVRMQAPRFFVEKDEVVLSANVHNYLAAAKSVEVALELDGGVLRPLDELRRVVSIEAGGEKRVDWRVAVAAEGQATVRMKALTDEESDAVEMRFPAHVHGMLKTDSYAGSIRPDDSLGRFTIRVPAERRPEQSRLEIRYSPSLAAAMVDALPYLVEYPYGCTEQTLNRFLPTVVVQHVLKDMHVDLAAVRGARANLNAQEIGDPQKRAAGWKRFDRNPVFDEQEVSRMVADGVQALAEMQLSDGGWGWFSGFGEHSWPHTTATVVHGLQVARGNGAEVRVEMLDRGVAWLKTYQEEQVRQLTNAATETKPYKLHADEADALIYMVLVDGGTANQRMQDFLYRDRTNLSVYGKALLGLALEKEKQGERLAMILRNVEQYLVVDDANQTAWLKMPEGNAWWYWHGSDVEAMAAYLKLLARTTPQAETPARLAKHLLNNRQNGTYWNSTRDTALCLEALAEFCVASGEAAPDMTVEILVDGVKRKEVAIASDNLFNFDDRMVLSGQEIESGEHTIEFRKQGRGPLYYNAYLANFTLEDPIPAAGLEVKVERHFYKLVRDDRQVHVAGSRGQAVGQRAEKYARQELPDLANLTSGDLVEIELVIDSKNDYEYLMFEDMKPSGFEPVEVRSGYNANALGAYMELRDNRVAFFVRWLARGRHSVSYRMRAETPGRFSALPARALAMYAPELAGNSGEFKLVVTD
ncbi:MAG: alpha-2-macroglobulin [Planctomycetia bacterium]|nr:alpha-2-macroglobulin [Planctomycetia bacterium]